MLILGGLNVCTDVGDCDCTRELFEYRKRVSTEKPMLALRAWIFWSKVLPPELSQTPEHFIIIYPSFSDKKEKSCRVIVSHQWMTKWFTLGGEASIAVENKSKRLQLSLQYNGKGGNCSAPLKGK